MTAELPHIVPLAAPAPVRTVADMPDSDIDDDREEYLVRLGRVLQQARKARRMTQLEAARRMRLSTATFTRWESGDNKISAYDLARLVRLYEFDADLAINPPASVIEVRRRLGIVPRAAQAAVRRALLRPLPPEGEGEPG